MTKKKIAKCLEELLSKKSIEKITIQDLMEKSGMTRQSFYYHFQDIYEVLEWTCIEKMIKPMDQETDLKQTIGKVFDIYDESRVFFFKVANNVEREKIIKVMYPSIEKHVRIIIEYNISIRENLGDKDFLINFLTTSVIQTLIDCGKSRKQISKKQVIGRVEYVLKALNLETNYAVLYLNKSNEFRQLSKTV